MGEPLRVEVTRGGVVESAHGVDAVIVGADGRVVSAWGDPMRPTLPRSAVKPIQALPLVTTGAAAGVGFGDDHLALACASHGGEPAHVAVVTDGLERLGLPVEALACGVHPPVHRPSADRLVADGRRPDPRHNTCSGKHCGFLAVCRHLGIDPSGYPAAGHPLHRDHVTPALEAACATRVRDQTPAVDGCGIPVWSVPLDRLASGWAGLGADPAGRRLLDAMTRHPLLVAGTGRTDTRLVEQGAGRVVVKTGAEGVFCGIDRVEGLGVALKVRDGATRAAEQAIEWLLARTGALPEPPPGVIRNRAGTAVGELRVAG